MNITAENDSTTQADDVLIPLTKVQKTCGFSKTSIYRMMSRGTFPKPAKRAGRSVRWRNSEVQQWVRNEWPAQAPA
ncbi:MULTISPECIES: helix-turn-helix transcriptional regulator [Stenotrophomonas]|uniref:helix-turn-helix transcriptional regulator n=1 Tax=Stenotrophomonas TaxID=40323 RepID=UPI001CC934F5|nr:MULTISPECIES: AlpA family phage regulatory protein [Stenotrophomonas]MBN5137676.1 AlpA family phage regulatory protein [Stenotrophomonas maltophilia]MDG2508674.1 AlpA family phage regulatory protein [Stenotrophomonas maltophilia]MDH7551829.1 AlpA family phage regulatory protein [Stenotrophomonas geniculata]